MIVKKVMLMSNVEIVEIIIVRVVQIQGMDFVIVKMKFLQIFIVLIGKGEILRKK